MREFQIVEVLPMQTHVIFCINNVTAPVTNYRCDLVNKKSN